jgi:hypothetical protein
MSLLTSVLERSYDVFNATDPEKRGRYLENLYQASCHMYRSFYDLKKRNALPAENLRILSYPRLMTDFEATMNELVEFLEITPDPSFFEKVEEQAEKQRDYRSSHAYSLEKWGLTEDRIRDDLAFVYQEYDL